MSGESTRAQLSFVRPDALERAFWPGRELDVHRGTAKVGTLRVTEVLSPALAGAPPPAQAPAPSGPPSRMSSVIFLVLVYLLLIRNALHPEYPDPCCFTIKTNE